MTFNHMLRRYFGWGHLLAVSARRWYWRERDLRGVLRLSPRLRSVGGHALRPFADFGTLGVRLRWYTVLRDPCERTISNYQHQVEKMGQTESFQKWLELPHNRNWHVRMLAGEQDLEAARQIVREKMVCIGAIERYHEFLLLLRHRMGWAGFNVTYERPRNPPRSNTVRAHIRENLAVYRDDLHAANELDQALYDWVMAEVYPEQIAQYGEERLRSDLATAFADPAQTRRESIRRLQSMVLEKVGYRALSALERSGRM
jgi:hypothetical protein